MIQNLMKNSSWLARAALIAALVATSSMNPAQAASSPAKKELTQKLLKLRQGDFEGLGQQIAGQIVTPVGHQASAFLQANVPPERRDATAKEIQTEFNKFGNEVGPLLGERAVKLAPSVVGPVLEEKFTEEELKQVIAVLESPGFRKYLQLAPELQRTLGQKLVADTQTLVEPKIRALEKTLNAKLNAAVPAAKAPSAPKQAASSAKK